MVTKFKCQNFETCGNMISAKHQKWCQTCSTIWQCRQAGYEPLYELKDGEICGLVLVRKDLYEKEQLEKLKKEVEDGN